MKHTIILLLVVAVFGCNTAHNAENIAVAKQFVKAVESLDYTAMENLLADEYEGFGPSTHHEIDKDAAIAQWKENVQSLYEKIEYKRSQFVSVTIPEGENAGEWVTTWAELEITYKEDRGSVTIWANTNYKVVNGQIVKSYTFYNEADVLEQLGYVFIHPEFL